MKDSNLTLVSTNKNSYGGMAVGKGGGNYNHLALGQSDGKILLWLIPSSRDAIPPLFEVIEPADADSDGDRIVIRVDHSTESVALKLHVSDNAALEEVTVDGEAIRLLMPEESELNPISPIGETYMIQPSFTLASDTLEIELYAADIAGNEQITTLVLEKGEPPEEAPEAETAVFERGSKWALVVGIGEYDNVGQPGGIYLRPPKTAVADADALAAFLIDEGNYKPEHVIKMTSETEIKPTDQNLLKALQGLTENTRRDDLALFYFSGLGYLEQRGEDTASYLLTQNANLALIDRTSISATELARRFAQFPAKVVVITIDISYSGVTLDQRGKPIPRMLPPKYYRGFQNSVRTSTLFSVTPNQQSYVRGDRNLSAFMYYMIEGLKGTADANEDQSITFPELAGYVPVEVATYVKRTWNAFQQPRSHLLADRVSSSMPIVSYLDQDTLVFEKIPDPKEAIYASKLLQADPDNLSATELQVKAYVVDLLLGRLTYDDYLTAVTRLRPEIPEEAPGTPK